MDAALRPCGLTVPQYACLEQLRPYPGLSSAELARATFVTCQSMHTVLAGLAERGLLTRPATAPQGRALPTELTGAGAGAEVLARASGAVADVERRMLAALPGHDLRRLHEDLLACAAALSGSGSGA